MNPPTSLTELRTYLESIDSFRDRIRQANVDVEPSCSAGRVRGGSWR
ncbi:hypothetical protein [Streptomyces phaeochromogenes]